MPRFAFYRVLIFSLVAGEQMGEWKSGVRRSWARFSRAGEEDGEYVGGSRGSREEQASWRAP